MTSDLNLWPIGNCQVSALIDRQGTFVWGCVPRVDGDPAFCALIGGDDSAEIQTGFWSIELDGQVRTEQEYLRNTPILVTRHLDKAGNGIEVTDFCPRFMREAPRLSADGLCPDRAPAHRQPAHPGPPAGRDRLGQADRPHLRLEPRPLP